MNKKIYTPKIDYLKKLGFREVRMYKHERLAIMIPGDPRSLYYFPQYNSFRHACVHLYPESDDDLETIIRCMTLKKTK